MQKHSGACGRCSSRKQKCSLTPVHPRTGKPDRRKGTVDLQQARVREEKGLVVDIGKGKEHTDDAPDNIGTHEESVLVPLPLTELSALGSLTLDSGSGASSAPGNTPSDSPATLSRPLAIEAPPPTLPPA